MATAEDLRQPCQQQRNGSRQRREHDACEASVHAPIRCLPVEMKSIMCAQSPSHRVELGSRATLAMEARQQDTPLAHSHLRQFGRADHVETPGHMFDPRHLDLLAC